MSTVNQDTVTILSGATVSNSIDLGEMAVVGMQNATLTSTAMTFQASSDNSTFVVVKNTAGSSYSVTVASDTYTVIPPADLAGIRWLKVVAGSAEGADRVIKLVVRSV